MAIFLANDGKKYDFIEVGMTLREISEAAGVSIRTVGRVLRNDPHVRAVKRERVESAVQRGGYVPNLLARGLRSKRSGMVGLLASGLLLEVRTKKFAAIESALSARGCRGMLGLTGGDIASEGRMAREYSRFCDGVIFVSDPSRETLEYIKSFGTPYVLCDSNMPERRVVRIDRESGVREALRLQRVNYRNFFFVTTLHSANEQRQKAFSETVSRMGVSGNARVVSENLDEFECGLTAAGEIAEAGEGLSMCYNDRIAAGLLKGLSARGCRVPEDFGIVGFDNDNFTMYTHKSISTVTQSVDELARKTVDMLFMQVEGGYVPEPLSVKTRFVARETTPPPSAWTEDQNQNQNRDRDTTDMKLGHEELGVYLPAI